jgi:hypothetical protein
LQRFPPDVTLGVIGYPVLLAGTSATALRASWLSPAWSLRS